MKKWIPKPNDTCTLKERDKRRDAVMYKIDAVNNHLNKCIIKRLEYSDLYKAVISSYKHKILSSIHPDILNAINTEIIKKFPTYRWEYEEFESYTVSLNDIEPVGETYLQLCDD